MNGPKTGTKQPHGNRRELSAAVVDRIVALMASGANASTIRATLAAEGTRVSAKTISRRMHELSPHLPVPPVPATPEDIPEGTDLSTLEAWIGAIQRQGEQAERSGDISAFGEASRIMIGLLEHKRKATPPKKPDPNEDPDVVKLGAEVAARLHRMIEQAIS